MFWLELSMLFQESVVAEVIRLVMENLGLNSVKFGLLEQWIENNLAGRVNP